MESSSLRSRAPSRCGFTGAQRGFTLVELMAVVTIVGVLAIVGVVALREHAKAARADEAAAKIQAISAAEESFRAENQLYLDVSADIETTLYPMATPGTMKYAWDNGGSSTTDNNWRRLAVTDTGPVRFGYAVKAGDAGGTPPVPPLLNPPAWPPMTGPWYVIAAKGDTNGDGVLFARLMAASFNPELYVENPGE